MDLKELLISISENLIDDCEKRNVVIEKIDEYFNIRPTSDCIPRNVMTAEEWYDKKYRSLIPSGDIYRLMTEYANYVYDIREKC